MKKQTMGEMIASLRKEQGMTQAELAEQMNITDKAVSKWERDLSCPDISSLPKLAEILHVSVDELMQGKSQNGQQASKVQEIVGLVLKTMVLAMGVAVTVLAILDKLDVSSGFKLLGIGLACAGITLLQKSEK